MILQALIRYYEILLNDDDSDVAPEGYTKMGVSFVLDISRTGKVLGVVPLYTTKQAKNESIQIAKPMIVPRYVEPTSNVKASFLCGKSAYVLGISDRDEKQTAFSDKRFKEFCCFNLKLLSKANCEAAKAMMAFLENHDPAMARTHPDIKRYLEDILKEGRFVFQFEGQLVHDIPAIKEIWDEYYAGKEVKKGQCLVTGDIEPLTHLHSKIKGVKGTTAGSLVSFNKDAFRSYGKRTDDDKGLNAPISRKAEFAYTTALNHLLSLETNRFYLDDTTVVFWAESDEPVYPEIFGAALINPEYLLKDTPLPKDKSAQRKLESLSGKVKRLEKLDWDHLLDDVAGNPQFYVLGLSPNQGRISVRFFVNEPFVQIMKRITQHHKDLEMIITPGGHFTQPKAISLRNNILLETVSPKSKVKKVAPLLEGTVTRAILTGSRYPDELYYSIINRIRADVDDKKKHFDKINLIRAAIIKAYLIRKYSHNQHPIKEVLVMSLNMESTYPPYVLGRLFAVLERTQKDANPNLNTTIKDRYFTSACTSPRSTFPTLLKLAQHHISKDDKYGFFNDKRIEELENLLDIEKNPLPARLTLDEQGAFILGFYHQRAAFYIKTNMKEIKNESEN